MQRVRAKFSVNYIEEFPDQKTIHASAVCSDKGENKDFAEAIPSGKIELSIDKSRPAADFFEVGKEYYLDFKEAPTSDEKP